VEASLGEEAKVGKGVSTRVAGVEAIDVKAETPGEVSGPAIAVAVVVQNQGTTPIDVSSAVVNVVASDGELGIGTTAGSPSPLTGTVAPGESAQGRYVFMLNVAGGREVTVSVNYGAGEPVAVFKGKAS
jgi:hypothetical protein